MNNDIKLTYRNDRGCTTVATTGIGQLFFVHRERPKVGPQVYKFNVDCKIIAEVTGTDDEFRAFCRWLAPARAEQVKARKEAYEAAKAEAQAKTAKAIELLTAIGIKAGLDFGGGISLNVDSVIAALDKKEGV